MPYVPRAMRTERSPIRFATPYLEVETRSAGVRSRETRQDIPVGSVAVPRAHIRRRHRCAGLALRPAPTGDSRAGLQARARGSRVRTGSAVTSLTGQHGELAPPGKARFALGGELRTDLSPFERRGGKRNATTCQYRNFR